MGGRSSLLAGSSLPLLNRSPSQHGLTALTAIRARDLNPISFLRSDYAGGWGQGQALER